MAKVSNDSKIAKDQKVHQLLRALLRTPKTRKGLVAAARSRGVTPHFVYGFIADAVRTGVLTVHKSGDEVLYQTTSFAGAEQPREGHYPAWLEPRMLPAFTSAEAFIDARRLTDEPQEEEEDT